MSRLRNHRRAPEQLKPRKHVTTNNPWNIQIISGLCSDGYGVIDGKKAYGLMNWDPKELGSL